MGIHDLWLFLLAGALVNITPGPDMALIIARSTRDGTRAGIVAALGVGVGTFIHIAGAAIGLSALILASALAFTVIKWIGALYLIYLGIQIWRSTLKTSEAMKTSVSLPSADLLHVFLQGVLSNALNPKVAVFFLAFLPQFVDADAPAKAPAFIMLGLFFDTVGTAWNIAVAWFAGRLATSSTFEQLKVSLERAIGALFVGVGIKLALSERT
jgi:RhtB (resistance to homoserine/threonine) family protein